MTVWHTNEDARQLPHSHPLPAKPVFAVDRRPQRPQGMFEISAGPLCMFRIDIRRSQRVLRDGVRGSDRLLRLQNWNKHIRSTRHCVNRVDRAKEACERISWSFDEPAGYLITEQNGQIDRIMRRYGFEAIDDPTLLPSRKRIRLAKNILISMMVFAQSAETLRRNTLRRVQVPLRVFRRQLERCLATASNRRL